MWIFPSLILSLLENGLSELGIDRRNDLSLTSDAVFVFISLEPQEQGHFLPNSGWLDVSSVLTGELKLYGMYVHTLYKNRINTYSFFPPSTLPASNTCALKVCWVAFGIYIFSSPQLSFLMTCCPVGPFLAPEKYCGKDFHNLTTRYVKNRFAFVLKLSCVCLIKGLDFVLKETMKNNSLYPFCIFHGFVNLCYPFYCSSLFFFSSLKNPGEHFIPNFQLAETWDEVFMLLPNQDLVPAHHSNLHFETPLKPFPILPIWNKQHSSILRAAEFSIQRDVIILWRKEVIWNKCQWEHVAAKCEQQKP